jgi:hypothetical protein
VNRLEFDTLARKGGWDYIYSNDDVQGSEVDMCNKWILFQDQYLVPLNLALG